MTTDSARTTRPRILIVDDDVPLLDALERAFDEAGEQVFVSSTFEGARMLLKKHPFDVLIADLRLKEFNGLQLVVLASELNPGIQLIVFSGFDDPVLREDAEQLGAIYLVKPVTSAYLLQLIRERRP